MSADVRSMGWVVVAWTVLGCAAEPLSGASIHIDPEDLSTDFAGTATVDVEGISIPETAVQLVRWPELSEVPVERTTQPQPVGPARIVIAPSEPLAAGWYATRVAHEGASGGAPDTLAEGDGVVMARFGVDVAPQLASAWTTGGLLVVRFSEALASAAEWTGVRVAAGGSDCGLQTQEAPARELVFDCGGAAEVALAVGEGVHTERGAEVLPFEGTVAVESLHRFPPM